jgi:[ribosomal protein S5]-alanine N-acetyltransferase
MRSLAVAGANADRRTARLQLRAPTQADLADFHRLHSDPACHPYDDWARHPDLEHSQTVHADICADWARDGLGYWIVRYGDVMLGVCGVRASGFTDRHRGWRATGTWNAYYRLVPAARGHGYAGEAMRAAAQCCAAIDPAAVIEARIAVGNLASMRLARSLGMQLLHTEEEPTGIRIDCYQGDAVELAGSALGDHR